MDKSILDTKLLTNEDEDLRFAGRLLAEGKVVAFPTETVYGLGANALDAEAVKKVYEAKGRPSDNPMIVHISDIHQARSLWSVKSEIAEKLMEAYWPGPLTIVMKSSDIVPLETRGGLDTVAVRMPAENDALKLIDFAKVPIAAPSANISGRPSPTKYEHVIEDMNGKVSAIVKGRDCKIGIESTVVLVEHDKILLLRPGFITPDEMMNVTGCEVDIIASDIESQSSKAPLSPGMKYKHYAPKAEMTIFRGDRKKVSQVINERKHILEEDGYKVGIIDFSSDDMSYAAQNLFAKLRDMDNLEVDYILATGLPEENLGMAVMNRMIKSAGYKIEDV